MRQLINVVNADLPPSSSSVFLRDLIVEARRLTVQLELLERLDHRAALLVRARIGGRLDEAGFGDMMRGLGKGAKKAAGGVIRGTQALNAKINDLGKLLQNTKPVQNFDKRYDDLKNQLAQKFPKVSATVAKYGEFAKTHPKTQMAIIGALTLAASVTTGPAGGAMVASILRGSNELLKGEKLSTAVGRTAKTAGLAWVAGLAIHPLGAAIAKHLVPFPTLKLTDHYVNHLQKIQMQYSLNGRQLYNVQGIADPESIARLQHISKAMSDQFMPKELGVDANPDKGAQLYKMFLEYSDKLFNPDGEIQHAITAGIKEAKADDAAKKIAFDALAQSSENFASTMQKIGKAVTAAVQSGVAALGAKPAGQAQPAAPAQQPAAPPAAPGAAPVAATPPAPPASRTNRTQPPPVQGTAAATAPAAAPAATATPTSAPAATTPAAKPGHRQPVNAPLWKQTMASFKQAGYADVTRPDVAYAISQHYKASGGKWAPPQAAAQAPLQAAA